MKNIDFLPSRYHEQNANRKNSLWRAAICVIFGFVIATAVLYQCSLHGMVQNDLRLLKPKKTLAQAKKVQFGNLQKRLDDAQAEAALYVYLNHFWPKTQILAELTNPLPRSITMTEVRFAQEPLQQASFQQKHDFNSKRKKAEEEKLAKLPPPLRDLTQVRQAYDQNISVIHIDGQTMNTAALHLYVAQLSVSPLFTSAKLSSLEVVDSKQQNGLSEFTLRVEVRPGYTQPLGPEKNNDSKLAVVKKQNPEG